MSVHIAAILLYVVTVAALWFALIMYFKDRTWERRRIQEAPAKTVTRGIFYFAVAALLVIGLSRIANPDQERIVGSIVGLVVVVRLLTQRGSR